MIARAGDDRITNAIAHLRSAMALLTEVGARQSAAHVATAIFCIPANIEPGSDAGSLAGRPLQELAV